MRSPFPVVPDIGLTVHKTFPVGFTAFNRFWEFSVRSTSEANIAKGCLTYYSALWKGLLFPPIDFQDVVADVGAHVGFFSIPIASQVSYVYSWEPVPANFQLLQRNIKHNKQTDIAATNAAVGKEMGQVTLYLGVQGTTGHTIVNKKRGGMSVEVECINLTHIVAICNPSILKLDCEGAEWEILLQPSDLSNIRAIVAELHKVTPEKLKELERVLKQAHFKWQLSHNSWFSKLIAYK